MFKKLKSRKFLLVLPILLILVVLFAPSFAVFAQDVGPTEQLVTATPVVNTGDISTDVIVVEPYQTGSGPEIIDQLQDLLSDLYPRLLLLLVLVLVDVLCGAAEALVAHKFDWKKLGEFYTTKLFPLVLGWLALSLLWRLGNDNIVVSLVSAQWGMVTGQGVGIVTGQGVVDAAWGLVGLALEESIRDNLKKIGMSQKASLPAAPKPASLPPAAPAK